MKKETKEFIELGEDHLRTAEVDLRNGIYKACCFWSQQAIEVFLKAYLIEKGKFDPKRHKTHDLRFLINECSEIDEEFRNLLSEDIDKISSYVILMRYDIELIRKVEKEDAERAVKIAEKIRDFVMTKLE